MANGIALESLGSMPTMSDNMNAAPPECIEFHVVHDCTLEDGMRLRRVRLAGAVRARERRAADA